MDDDWLAMSASALVVGVVGLALASLMGAGSQSTVETLRMVREQDGRWLAVAVIYFLSSVGLILGVPCLQRAVAGRGRAWLRLALVPLSVGFVGVAGYAILMVVVRTLVVEDLITTPDLDAIAREPGILVFLYAWVGGFLVGEALLAVSLWRAGARAVPRWIPGLLGLHVAAAALAGGGTPEWISRGSVLLLVAALAGLSVHTVQHALPGVGVGRR